VLLGGVGIGRLEVVCDTQGTQKEVIKNWTLKLWQLIYVGNGVFVLGFKKEMESFTYLLYDNISNNLKSFIEHH
jgi:hypothetical protein